jgi:hypothetical protein
MRAVALHLDPAGEPGPDLVEAPAVHADFAPLAALALAHEDRAAARVEVWFGQRHCLADSESGPPEHDDQRPEPESVVCRPCPAHDLLDPRRVRRIAKALVARRAIRVEARQGGRRTPATRRVEQLQPGH